MADTVHVRLPWTGAEGYRCRYCEAPIAESFGFMDAGDFDRALQGCIATQDIRVTCPRCDLARDAELRELVDAQ